MICPSCGQDQPDNPVFCRGCGQRFSDDRTIAAGGAPTPLFPIQPVQPLYPAQTPVKVRVNRVGRVLSGLYALYMIMGVINGLAYYAESKLPSELAVDIICSIVALVCLFMAFVPGWISRTVRLKLENGGVFALVFVLLVIVGFVAIALGPEPPGGWLNYGA